MEKIKSFFRNLSEKRSYQIVFFVVSMCVIFSTYFVLRIKIEQDVSRRYTVEEDKNLVKEIEAVSIADDILTISGWCFYRDIESNTDGVQVFLRNVENEEETVWLEVEDVIREDINAYYDCEYDYSHSGFLAKVPLKKLSNEGNEYEILIKLSYSEEQVDKITNEKKSIDREKTVSTKMYICEGTLFSYRQQIWKEPVVTKSEKLNEVFEKGRLLVYRDDYDVYVYQYQDKIYWVAGEHFYFEEDGNTKIQYQLDTTRSDKLPEHRIKNNWDWDNLGFDFEQVEMKEDCYPYRVAVQDIPTSYPITCFWTGYHDGIKWIWREDLNISIGDFFVK